MTNLLYRTRQYVFSIFVKMVQNKKTELIRGNGSFLKLPKLLKEECIDSILIVTTDGFVKRKTLDQLFELLRQNDIKYELFTGLKHDPSVSDVESGVSLYNSVKAKCIVAIGGGSVLDCAKVIGARVSNPKTSVRKMRGMLKIKKALPPYYPIPATCGTGSEATAAAVITDTINDVHYKYAVTDLKLIPKKAILDPSLLLTLPDMMLASTTIDALTHSLEAYLNLFASKDVINDSMESVKLIFDNYQKAFSTRSIDALDNLLYASFLAGVSITHNFVGYVHALSHAIGAIYSLQHGYLNSIILPVVLKKYQPNIEEKMKALCKYLNIEKDESYTLAIIKELNKIKSSVNLPSTIKELKEEDFDEIVKRANKEANPSYPVPMILNKKELKELLYILKG